MRIIQVLDYYASGNAVANCAVTYYRYCKRLGIDCAIVARLIDKQDDMISEMSLLDDLLDEDIIMYHLCIGTPLNDEICNYECKKVLVYHNITPPEMLQAYDSNLAKACEMGLAQLANMKDAFDICLADSEFNKQDMISVGYCAENITVIPPFVSKEDFSKTPDEKIVKRMSDGWTNILFVGRVSPHKKYEDVIKAFDYYKKNINPKSRLILAGGVMESYYLRLVDYVRDLKLKDVIFTKQIPFSHLLAYYATANIFLCMSEHEGYCIPLIEAMEFDIPVIAFDAGAVKGTMGNSGILIDDKNPVFVAKIIDKITKDSSFREGVLEGQRQYLKTIDDEHIFNLFAKWTEGLEARLGQTIQKKDCIINENSNPYDVVVVIKADDWDIAKRNIKYIRNNLNPKRVVIVSSKKIKNKLKPEDNVSFIDEDSLYPGMSFSSIREIFEVKGHDRSLTGWFLQQFLKMSYSFVCKDDYYLVWDADTIPVKPIDMINKETGKPMFNMKPEYVAPYFSTLKNLLGLKKCDEESFITEHMLFNVEIMKALIAKIEQNHKYEGTKFFEKIINATDFSKQGNSFSEFETYGTFCEYYYPNVYEKRHLKTFRAGKIFLGTDVDDSILDWVSKDIDTISFEYPQKVNLKSQALSHNRKYREKHTFMNLVSRIYLTETLFYSDDLLAVKAALEMDYPWQEKAVYYESEDYAQKQQMLKIHENKIVKFWSPNSLESLLALRFADCGWNVMIFDQDKRCRDNLNNNPFIGATILRNEWYANVSFVEDKEIYEKTDATSFISISAINDFDKETVKNSIVLVNGNLSLYAKLVDEYDATYMDISLLKKDNITDLFRDCIILLQNASNKDRDLLTVLMDNYSVQMMKDMEEFKLYSAFIGKIVYVVKDCKGNIPDEFLQQSNIWFV